MILTLSIISIVGILFFIIGAIVWGSDDDSEEVGNGLMVVGFLIVAVTGAFGWGTWASWGHKDMIVNEIQADTIVKTNTTAYAEFTYELDGEVKHTDYKYTKYVDYMSIDTVQFYQILYFDYYGNEQDVVITFNTKYSKYELGVKMEAD